MGFEADFFAPINERMAEQLARIEALIAEGKYDEARALNEEMLKVGFAALHVYLGATEGTDA